MNTEPDIGREELEVVYRNRTYRFGKKMTVARLLQELDLNPETVMVAREGELVTKDQHVLPGDKVRVLPVVSGG
ncbi:MAG: MoaD/ThiS family protein [Spirochaetota bacterium]